MHLRSLLAVGLLTSALPLVSAAQTTAPVAPRFSLGLTGTYVKYDTPSRIIPTLTAGLQLTPRLALQLGVGYVWSKNSYYNGSFFDSQSNQFHNDVTFTSYQRLLTAPLSVRYTVTPLAKRWQLDAIGGATALYYFGRYDESFTTPTQPRQIATRDSYDHFEGMLSVGLGLRYALTPGVELVGDALINTAWNNPYNGYIRSYPGSFSLGARYRFGAR